MDVKVYLNTQTWWRHFVVFWHAIAASLSNTTVSFTPESGVCVYRIAGNFGGEFILADWRF